MQRIARSAAAAAPDRPPAARDASVDQGPSQQWLYRFVKPLASLRLTVTLLGLAIFLVFAGTLAQVDQGIWAVMDRYFRTRYGVAWIDLYIFFPRTWNVPKVQFPYPGGYLIGGLLLLNLLAAHAVRFKLKAEGKRLAIGAAVTGLGVVLTGLLIGEVHFAIPQLHDFYVELLLITLAVAVLGVGFWRLFDKRCGIVMLHTGLIVLLTSEAITGWFANEGQMRIPIGGSSSFTRDIRVSELAIIDPAGASDPTQDAVTVVPERLLRRPGTIRSELLPFDIQVKAFLVNSGVVSRDQVPAGRAVKEPLVKLSGPFASESLAVVERPPVSGASVKGEVDMPAVDVAFKDKQTGRTLFDGRLSLIHTELVGERFDSPPQLVGVESGGKKYEVGLRFKRVYRPFTLTLKEFNHDVYPGTTKPKDYSAFVRLTDPSRNEDREVRIWMNHPLRYAGETFFQSSMFPQEAFDGAPVRGTVLQVVKNPGRIIPYLSCILVAGGLIAHFMVGLSRFTQRRLAP